MQLQTKTTKKSALAVSIKSLGGAFTQDDYNKAMASTGKISGGLSYDNGDYTVRITAGTGFLRSSNSNTADIYYVSWPENLSIPVPIEETKYIYITYNNGSPVVTSASSYDDENHSTIFLSEVHNVGGELQIHNSPFKISDISYRFHRWMEGVIGNRVESGLQFADLGNRQFSISTGVVWDVHLNKRVINEFDISLGHTFSSYYRDGSGGWARTSGLTQWDNLKYDDGSGTLQSISPGYFGCNFIVIGMSGHVGVIYGRCNNATKTDADGEAIPDIRPEEYDEHGVWVAKIVFEQGASTIRSIKELRPQAQIIPTTNPLPIVEGGTGRQDKIGAFGHLSPTTTKGDLIVSDGSNNVRVAIGIDNQILIADSSANSGVRWIDSSNIALPTTTKGDIIVYDGNSNVRLPTGTNGQILVADSSATTGVKWSDSTAAPTFDILAPSTIKGDLIVYNGSANVRIAKGTDNQVLVADSSAIEGLRWSTLVDPTLEDISPVSIKGDLIVFNGSLHSRVAVGTNGQILVADSSTTTGVKWADTTAAPTFDTLAPSTTKGDLIAFDGNSNTRLAKGIDGQYLVTDSSTVTGLKWINISTQTFDELAPTTTKGDLIVYNGSANVRIAKGTNNQILVTDSSAVSGVKWADSSSITFTQPGGSPISMAQNDIQSVTHPAITAEKVQFSVFIEIGADNTDLIPTMTTNTAPSGIASSSTIYSGAYEPYVAFNDVDDAGWATAAGATTGWIAYQFDSSQVVNKYTLKCQNHVNGPAAAPKNWTFEGWDSSAWVVLDTQTNITSWTATVAKTYSFSNTVSYIKYRVNVSANNGQTYLSLSEVEMINENPHYEMATLGRYSSTYADFGVNRMSSTTTNFKRLLAGTSNVYINVVTS